MIGAVFAVFVWSAFGATTLTPYNGVVALSPSGQPKFTITTPALVNPPTVTDGNGNSATDSIQRIEVSCPGIITFPNIWVSSYNSLWSDPRGVLPPGRYDYLVRAIGATYSTYSNWIDGHWVEDGYWEDDEWHDTSWWMDGYWDYGINGTPTVFSTASISFYITSTAGATTLTPFNGLTNIAAPAQPKFTLSSSLSNPQTVTDAYGNTRTDRLDSFEIFNPSYGWFPTITPNAGSYGAQWSDPRGVLTPSIQTYTVHPWAMHYQAYNNGWVAGHWEEIGHWVAESEGGDTWVVDESWWVDSYWETGFIETLEEMLPRNVTFNISTGTAQTITFPTIGTHSWGEPEFPLTATASSGLPITYTLVSGPASLSGNMLTVTGAGTVVVQASQNGNSVYGEATPVTRSSRPSTVNHRAFRFRRLPPMPSAIRHLPSRPQRHPDCRSATASLRVTRRSQAP